MVEKYKELIKNWKDEGSVEKLDETSEHLVEGTEEKVGEGDEKI